MCVIQKIALVVLPPQAVHLPWFGLVWSSFEARFLSGTWYSTVRLCQLLNQLPGILPALELQVHTITGLDFLLWNLGIDPRFSHLHEKHFVDRAVSLPHLRFLRV